MFMVFLLLLPDYNEPMHSLYQCLNFILHTHTHIHTHTHWHTVVAILRVSFVEELLTNMFTLTCTVIAYPRPDDTMAFWGRTSDGVRVMAEEMFTATDIDFTVTMTVIVPCEPESYRCMVANEQGTQHRDVPVCTEGGHVLVHIDIIMYI